MAQRLSFEERIEIQAGIAADETDASIAHELGRARTTITREITLGGRRRWYRASVANKKACRRARRPKTPKLAANPHLADHVTERMEAGWSPAAIAAGMTRSESKFDPTPRLRCCAETIYRAAYDCGRSGLAPDQWKNLPSRRRRRRKRGRHDQAKRSHVLGNFTPLAARPLIADGRTEVGHWEGDLIMGSYNRSALVTLVDRMSRFTIVGQLADGHDAVSVRDRLAAVFASLPGQHRLTLTWDQGSEMARWAEVQAAVEVSIYFCDPHSPWQRPTNENTNRLLRRFYPKGTDLARIPIDRIVAATRTLNTMPRRSLGWVSPSDVYALSCKHR